MKSEIVRAVSKLAFVLGLSVATSTAQVASGSATPAAPPPADVPPPNPPRPVPTAPPVPVPFGAGGMMDPNNLPLRVMGAGVFELANVTMNKQQRTVSFPAIVNMDQGPMEYFLVATYGKVHESILRTETLPYHIHVAMLLLDAAEAGTNAPSAQAAGAMPQGKPATISTPAKEVVFGDKISVEVSWRVDGKDITRKAEELVLNLETKAPMAKGHWVYNGSQVVAGTFGAQTSGSLVSLITDRESLMNNVGPGHENDDIWAVNTNSLPPANTPLRVTLRLDGGRAKP